MTWRLHAGLALVRRNNGATDDAVRELRSAIADIERPGEKPTGIHFWLQDGEGIYPLKVGLNSVGRMPDNDVIVPDGSVSRRHCAIIVHAGDGCELHDTASKNGTFLNGQRIQGPTRLAHGDEIRMCDHKIIFQTDTPPAEAGDVLWQRGLRYFHELR